MREVDLFGLILAVQMLVIIALGLHNRHIAALAREKMSALDDLRRTLAAQAAAPANLVAAKARIVRRKAA